MRPERFGLLSVLAVGAVLLAVSAPLNPSLAQVPVAKPLYERLGGVYAIATVVDDFIERVLANDVLNANPAIKAARDRVPKAGLKYRVTEMVCSATGGPEKYHGRSMKDSHKHLNITEAEWNALVADFQASLNKFKVPNKEQQELFAIVGSTKGDIVMPPRTAK